MSSDVTKRHNNEHNNYVNWLFSMLIQQKTHISATIPMNQDNEL